MEFLFFGRHTQYTQLSNTSDVKDKLNIKILTKNLAIIWIYIVLQLVSKQCLAIELQRTSEYHPDVCQHFYTRFLAKKWTNFSMFGEGIENDLFTCAACSI